MLCKSFSLDVVMIMAIIKMKKLVETPESEAAERLKELRLELSKERASSEIGTVKNPGRIREIRRSIARIMFEQNRRKMATKKTAGAKSKAAVSGGAAKAK